MNKALISAARFLFQHFSNLPCDDDGVSNCVRCNAVFLAGSILDNQILKTKSGQELLEFIVSAGIYHTTCAECGSHGCVTTWAPNAEEQLEAFLTAASHKGAHPHD